MVIMETMNKTNILLGTDIDQNISFSFILNYVLISYNHSNDKNKFPIRHMPDIYIYIYIYICMYTLEQVLSITTVPVEPPPKIQEYIHQRVQVFV